MAPALAAPVERDDQLKIVVDGCDISLDVEGSPPFQAGSEHCLSGPDTDITYGQPWYEAGFGVFPFLSHERFEALQAGIAEAVAGIIKSTDGLSGDHCSEAFNLEHYHRLVTTDEAHFKVVGRTRDLFPKDFGFTINDLIDRIEDIVGFGLTDVDPATGEQLHIIVRINRPGSNDFNPPHKDIYEVWDQAGRLPRFLNIWIPVCGVTPASALPLAPGSHLIREDRILRTRDGGLVNGNRYRVRAIASWDGQNTMVRAPVSQGEVLVFSSHLIHGLAINQEPDRTRVALEFRLFRKQPR